MLVSILVVLDDWFGVPDVRISNRDVLVSILVVLDDWFGAFYSRKCKAGLCLGIVSVAFKLEANQHLKEEFGSFLDNARKIIFSLNRLLIVS